VLGANAHEDYGRVRLGTAHDSGGFQMGKKVIGMARNVGRTARQRRWATMLSLVVVVAAGLFFMRTVLAVHETGHFELDGDATSQATDDWDRVCFQQAKKEGLDDTAATARCTATGPTTGSGFDPDGAGGPLPPRSGAVAVSWTYEPDTSASIFTGGGSKDPIDIPSWAWKNEGGLPDKDNLLHAYAARYSLAPTGPTGPCPNGTGGSGEPSFRSDVPCEVLFFGSDRYDNSGDAQQGFWFLQNQVTLGNNKLGGGAGFTGTHKAGDLLIISDFSNGGTVSTISLYKWDPTCKKTGTPKSGGVDGLFCADANLEQLRSLDQANCLTVLGQNDPACGLVNNADSQPTDGLILMPWEFHDKSGTPNNGALAGEFYEAGVNLSKLGLGGECFSSVVSETRSSTSTTAVLKDFVIGQFANCVPGLSTLASADFSTPVIPGTAVHDTATVKVTTTSTNVPDPTGTVTFFLCAPVAVGQPPSACTTGGTNIGTGTLSGGTPGDGEAVAVSPDVNCAIAGAGCSTATGVNPLASGVYCFRAEWPGDANYPGSQTHTNSTTECFAVKDTSDISTAQKWLPNDSATVTLASGATATGTVTFTLYDNGTCDGNVIKTYSDVALDVTGTAKTNNTTDYIVTTPGATVSWLAVYTPTDPSSVVGSTATCEKTVVTITDK
jgi:hypothetical protein